MINIQSIWENHKPMGNIIIRTRIDEIPHLYCFVATNHITRQHLYIMSVANNVSIPILKIIVSRALKFIHYQTKLKTKLNYIFIFWITI